MNKVVFTFGRFNPPTKGHEKLMKAVAQTAEKECASNVVFLSHTQNKKTDPLSWDYKARICTKAFPFVNIDKNDAIKTPFQALEFLSATYRKAIFIVGSDQVEEFNRMKPYAEKWNIELEIRSAGRRNDSGTINGISASRMRRYAAEGKYEEFMKWLPENLSEFDGKEILSRVILGLGK